MGAPKKLTIEQVRQALTENRGLKALSAESLGVVYNTLMKYVNRDATCQKIIEHTRQKRRDKAEFKLDEAIEKGEAWAIAMTLKADPERGYSDKIDITSKGNEIGVKIIEVVLPPEDTGDEQ